MGSKNNRYPFFNNIVNKIKKILNFCLFKSGCWFIKNQQFRISIHCFCNLNNLHFSRAKFKNLSINIKIRFYLFNYLFRNRFFIFII